MSISHVELGETLYNDALDLQFRTHENVLKSSLDGTVISLEHKPVITLGNGS